jgi:hypothetical protein
LDSPEVAVARFAARISLWALCVSGGVLFISVCVFGLELRRWLNEGVRLSLTVITDARLISGSQEDKNTYVSLTVMNRGSAPTTITHMIQLSKPLSSVDFGPAYPMDEAATAANLHRRKHRRPRSASICA